MGHDLQLYVWEFQQITEKNRTIDHAETDSSDRQSNTAQTRN